MGREKQEAKKTKKRGREAGRHRAGKTGTRSAYTGATHTPARSRSRTRRRPTGAAAPASVSLHSERTAIPAPPPPSPNPPNPPSPNPPVKGPTSLHLPTQMDTSVYKPTQTGASVHKPTQMDAPSLYQTTQRTAALGGEEGERKGEAKPKLPRPPPLYGCLKLLAHILEALDELGLAGAHTRQDDAALHVLGKLNRLWLPANRHLLFKNGQPGLLRLRGVEAEAFAELLAQLPESEARQALASALHEECLLSLVQLADIVCRLGQPLYTPNFAVASLVKRLCQAPEQGCRPVIHPQDQERYLRIIHSLRPKDAKYHHFLLFGPILAEDYAEEEDGMVYLKRSSGVVEAAPGAAKLELPPPSPPAQPSSSESERASSDSEAAAKEAGDEEEVAPDADVAEAAELALQELLKARERESGARAPGQGPFAWAAYSRLLHLSERYGWAAVEAASTKALGQRRGLSAAEMAAVVSALPAKAALGQAEVRALLARLQQAGLVRQEKANQILTSATLPATPVQLKDLLHLSKE